MTKFKIKNFTTVIYDEEHTQEVEYIYSIDNSIGLLKINLTIPDDADQVEQFIIHLKDIYRGLKNYVVYHGKWKYTLDMSSDDLFSEYYLTKRKMW